MLNERKFTRISCEQSDKKIAWEVPYEDVNLEDMSDALKTIMVGMTFHPNAVEKLCKSYLEATGEYCVTEIVDK